MHSSSPGPTRAPRCSCSATRPGLTPDTPLLLLLLGASPVTSTSHQQGGLVVAWLAKSRPGTRASVTSSSAAARRGSRATIWDAAPACRGTGRLWPRDQNTQCAHTRSSTVGSRAALSADATARSPGPASCHMAARRARSVGTARPSVVPRSAASSLSAHTSGEWNSRGSASTQGASGESRPRARSTARYPITTPRSSSTSDLTSDAHMKPTCGSAPMFCAQMTDERGKEARVGCGGGDPQGFHQGLPPHDTLRALGAMNSP
mmetsp:Transcript_5551/g.13815  ORF Transcript_5551/g.13815 Transcript_5551/m.13815 type:complete len:262 (-) Transcript_5551:394-1179(-)